ncbi:Prephenate dehydratase-domain-containing protein [Fusarium flagelliforme]|uniref:Prephenate dehydratase-domain-containing protein n=1 Tax=Fusarium flagelliforme TaxID=2675880 RepID=UPI001E8D5F53|nr:Prephenate dehydratase-domain-containing protein [Fusarium flagelliforme]KAH7182791.1 Prephenate dehydratase-domain-containing protein [Fusarium flagelliforme]
MASQRKPLVSFLGPVASYTHQAVRQAFSDDTWEFQPAVTIDDVFEQVQEGQVQAGVVPFENSTNGSVVFTLDNLADRANRYPDITVDGETYVDVHHCLVGHRSTAPIVEETAEGSGACTPTTMDPSPSKPRSKPLASLKHIQRLYSHPQAFGQCTAFISTYLKGVEIFEVSSTSKAAEIVSKDTTGTWAAISSELAAGLNGLDFLGKSIEDREDNTTRFLVIGTNAAGPKDLEKTKQAVADKGSKSLVSFTVPHTSPGALADALSCFRAFNLNLTSINSRPSLVQPFQYIFFIEFEGHKYDDPEGRVNGALERISCVAESWRWLGSWERYI